MKKANYLIDSKTDELVALEEKPIIFGRAIPLGRYKNEKGELVERAVAGSIYYFSGLKPITLRFHKSEIEPSEVIANIPHFESNEDDDRLGLRSTPPHQGHYSYRMRPCKHNSQLCVIPTDFSSEKFIHDEAYRNSLFHPVYGLTATTTSPFYQFVNGRVVCIGGRNVMYFKMRKRYSNTKLREKFGVNFKLRYTFSKLRRKKLYAYDEELKEYKTGVPRIGKFVECCYGVNKSKGKRMNIRSGFLQRKRTFVIKKIAKKARLRIEL